MQSTSTSNKIKLTTTKTTTLTPATQLTTLNNVNRNSNSNSNHGGNIDAYRATQNIKTSLSQKSTKTIETTTAKTTTTTGFNSRINSGNSSNAEATATREIEEISKKISEHADAIYRTWKSRGLAPTELLDIYTNAAAAAAAVQIEQSIGSGDIFGVEAAAAAETTTEGLQQLVKQFVIKDKEQRGVNSTKIATKTTGASTAATAAGTLYGGSALVANTTGLNKSQRTTEILSTIKTMPENIGSKVVTQKSVSGGGGNFGGGVGSALKQTMRTTGIQKSIPVTAVTASTTTPSSTSSATSATLLMKSSINNEQASGKKLAKSTAATTTATATTTPTTFVKNNTCVKNMNSGNVNSSGGVIKSTTSATTTTNVTPTTKRSLNKISAGTTSNAAPSVDINLNLDLNFDDLQLDVNGLSQLQSKNLFKIKEFIQENAVEPKKATTATTTTSTTTPSTTTTTTTPTKIAMKSKRLNTTSKSNETLTDSPTTTTATALKTKKTLSENLQNIKNNNNNNNNSNNSSSNCTNNSNNTASDVSAKRNAKNLNTNNSSNNSNNNKNNFNNNTNKNNSNNSGIGSGSGSGIRGIGETNNDATISKLISTNDKMSNKLNNNSHKNNNNNNNNNNSNSSSGSSSSSGSGSKQTIEKTTMATTAMLSPTAMSTATATSPLSTTSTTKSTTKSIIVKSPTLNASTATASASTNVTNVDEREQQSIKAISSTSNGSSASADHQQTLHDHVAVAQKSPLIKTAKKLNQLNESEVKSATNNGKTFKTEKSSNKSNSHSNKQNINENNNNNSEVIAATLTSATTASSTTPKSTGITTGTTTSTTTTVMSNMPAPTKFKSGRATTGAAQDKTLARPFLTRGSVAERVLMFEKCPDVRNSFLNIKRPDIADAPPKSLLKVKLHATPPTPPEQRSLQQEIRSTKSVYIPRFYFPHGKPQPQIAQERILRGILSAFDSYPNNQVTKDDLPRILKLCGLPFYWRMPVMVFCQQSNSVGLVERQRFVEFWKQMNVYCHDAASRFVYILSRGQRFRSYIAPEDLVPLVQDVVDTHPGLAFLKEATEFHSRYVHTVIARIFYSVNRCWSGKITMSELKKSDLLEILTLLEEEEDINQIMAFFSYEHFYVIYCKFWELDKDHDLLINQDDLARHSDHALSTRIVERIFSGCVTRSDNKKNADDEPKMSYTDFVWFLLSEEDKRTPTAIEYWFRCMDLDGDGLLSMYELEYFYEEQQQRMESIGIETLPFEDCLCQMLDMIKPQRRDAVSLSDLKKCKMTHVFFDTFFNLEKYLDHEQRDPFASQRDEYTSDWDRFAAQEYELLISEEND